MDCPKCTTGGKPTPMRRDITLVGGGSTENRQSGDKSVNGCHFWTCWQCGTHIDIHPEPMKLPQIVRKVEPMQIKRPSPFKIIATDMAIKFADSIKAELKRGATFDTIAALISKATGRRIISRHLEAAYNAKEKTA